jgi:glyoxylase-like metal-dependent hydrolase (beta-lactamase superfamily II)
MEINRIIIDLPLDSPKFSAIYVIGEANVVVDAGYINDISARKIEEGISDMGFNLQDLSFLITHHHIDHIGLPIWKEVKSWMHPLEIAFLKLYTEPTYFARPYMEWMRKYDIGIELVQPLINFFYTPSKKIKTHASPKIEVKSIHPLEDGEMFSKLKVIHTPGHSPGHLCFYVPEEKIIFSGDLVLSLTTTHVGYYPGYTADPVGDQIKSLKKLLNYEIDVVYPAHEEIIRNPEKRINELIEHYSKRLEEVLFTVDEPMKVVEIASKVQWSGGTFDELSGWSKLLAVSETLAFLKHLVNEGKIGEVEIDGVHHFKRD